jgi:hypothetical protein
MKTILLLLFTSIVVLCKAQSYYNYVPNTAAGFLRTTIDARSAGMGNAALAISNDDNCLFTNFSKAVFNDDDKAVAINYTLCLAILVLKIPFYQVLVLTKYLTKNKLLVLDLDIMLMVM